MPRLGGWVPRVATFPQEEVRKLGRFSERWRFEHPLFKAPRASVLGATIAAATEEPSAWEWAGAAADWEQAPRPLGVRVGKQEECVFQPVPFAAVDRPWTVTGRYKWRRIEGMPVLEARATLHAVKHMLRRICGHHKRHLVLSDSMSAIFAIDKGRGRTFGLRRVTQQIGALLLASGSTIHMRWVASEMNPAHGPSRGSLFPSRPAVGQIHGDPPGDPAGGTGEKEDQKGSTGSKKDAQKESQTTAASSSAAEQEAEAEAKGSTVKGSWHLNKASVGPAARVKYSQCWARLVNSTGRIPDHHTPAAEVDELLCQVLNEMFLEGQSLSEANYMNAAVLFRLPHLRSPRQMLLPVAKQTLAGWRKLDPPLSRMPLPQEVVWLMAVFCFKRRRFQEGLMMLLAMELYLRPGELDGIRVMDLVPPVGASPNRKWSLVLHPWEEGQPSKAQESDETILFDLPLQEVLAETIYRVCKAGLQGKNESLFSCKYETMKDWMKKAASHYHMEALGLGTPSCSPVATCRGLEGFCSSPEGNARHPTQREMEGLLEHQKVPGGRPPSTIAATAARRHTSKRHAGLRRQRRMVAVPALTKLRPSPPVVFLEVFSGCGQLGRSVARFNLVAVLLWDITLGEEYDLRRRSNRWKIAEWIRCGWVEGFHLGTPCESFTRARDVPPGPLPLRSDLQPLAFGTPGSEAGRSTQGHDRQPVDEVLGMAS